MLFSPQGLLRADLARRLLHLIPRRPKEPVA